MHWKHPKYPAGSEVVVHDVDNMPLGKGVLLTDFEQDADNEMPAIKLADDRIIYGYECWWIPVREIQEECPRCSTIFELTRSTIKKNKQAICPDCKLIFAV